MIKGSWLEDPRQIILREVGKTTPHTTPRARPLAPVRNPESLPRSCLLPPLHTQSECRRFRTEPHRQQNSLRELQRGLNMSSSRVLSQVSRRLPSLQSLNLVEGGAVINIRYSGHIRIPTVHNDYHNSKTNAGYSRNKMGGIYPK